MVTCCDMAIGEIQTTFGIVEHPRIAEIGERGHSSVERFRMPDFSTDKPSAVAALSSARSCALRDMDAGATLQVIVMWVNWILQMYTLAVVQ